MVLKRRALVALILLTAFALLYMLWIRNAFPFVVEELRVTGASVQSEEIAAELQRAAGDMTTLNVDEGALEAAVARFPTVRSLEVDTNFPGGLTIEIDERPPVASVETSAGPVAVAGDGVVLDGLSAVDLDLPPLEVDVAPSSGSLEGEALQQALALGAAPEPLRPFIARSAYGPNGIVVRLRGGIELRFGTADEAEHKWQAGAAVLADPKLGSIAYIDLRVPSRPAAGGAIAEEETEPIAPELVEAAIGSTPESLDAAATPIEPAVEPAAATEPVPAEPVEPAPSDPAATPAPPVEASPQTGAIAP